MASEQHPSSSKADSTLPPSESSPSESSQGSEDTAFKSVDSMDAEARASETSADAAPRVRSQRPPSKRAPRSHGPDGNGASHVDPALALKPRSSERRARSGRNARAEQQDIADLADRREALAKAERNEPSNDRPAADVTQPQIYPRTFEMEALDDDALKVLKRLHRHGHQAFLVGGCVRDVLLNRHPKDFDVATSARPYEVRDVFRNCRIIGRRFRLAHILFGPHKIIETATFRRDPGVTFEAGAIETSTQLADDSGAFGVDAEQESDTDYDSNRTLQSGEFADTDLLIRADNVWGEPHEDARRRDFTINGLFYDVERDEVIDYVGGMRDIEARTLRTIGVPEVRFREDPVRILRAIKFAARLDFGIDPTVYDAILNTRLDLRRAAPARLYEELMRLLRGGAAHRSIFLAWEMGVLAAMMPHLHAFLDDGLVRETKASLADAEVADGEAKSELSTPMGHTDRIFRRLSNLDSWIDEGESPSDAVLLAALLCDWVEDALADVADAATAYEEAMTELSAFIAIPRRMRDRVRVLCFCQRRLRSGKYSSFIHREFFREAVQVFELSGGVLGESFDETQDEGLPRSKKRRRRRRSR